MAQRDQLMNIKKRVLVFSGSVFLLEFSFFSYSLYWNSKWGWNELRASISLLLFFLASYQFSEVLICSLDKKQFGKIYGHVSITFLPPLGLWLIRSTNTSTYGLEYITTVLAFVFVLIFARGDDTVQIIACERCFVRYRYDGSATHYGKYYFGTIAIALTLLLADLVEILANDFGLRFNDPSVLLLTGYLVFLIPTAISLYVFKMDGSLVSSTMCKWASLFALILIVLLIQSA